MGRCFICDPPADVEDAAIAAHMLVEHDMDLDALAEKWPDGEWVIHDETLEPDDFVAPAEGGNE